VIFAIVALAVLLAFVIGLVVVSEVRARRKTDPPATLEGGGSHLTVRKEK
jgi:hypothetical protein